MKNSNITQNNFIYRTFWETAQYDIKITEAGWHDYDEFSYCVPSIKEDYVIHFVIRGKGYYEVLGKKYEVSENNLFLIKPAERIMYYPCKDKNWEYVWIGFEGKDSAVFLEQAKLNDTYVVDFGDVSEVKDLIFSLIKDGDTATDILYAQGVLNILCSKIIKQMNNGEEVAIEIKDETAKAVNYVKKNYNKEITVEKMAKYLSMNRSTLYKMFKKEFGMSPFEYLSSYRLETARRRVLETSIPIKTIAFNAGFNSYHHFSTTFKKKYKYSPLEYRKRQISYEKE